MNVLINDILEKFNQPTLDELAEDLPTSLTADSHIVKGIEYYNQGKLWEAFHHFSLTHSTLLYHRYKQERFQSDGSSSSNKDSPIESKLISYLENLALEDGVNVLRPETSEETQKLLRMLPEDWTVVQVSSENRMSGSPSTWKKAGDPLDMAPVYVSRCSCGPSPSLIIKRVAPPTNQRSVRSILQELESIRSENKVISKYYADDYTKYVMKREEINNRVRVLVQSIDVSWLRFYSCLFLGRLPEQQTKQVLKMLQEAVSSLSISLTDHQMQFLLLMATYPKPKSKSSSEILASDFPLKSGISSVINKSVRSSAVKDLEAVISKISAKCHSWKIKSREPVILILDKSVVSLPWEMTSAMKDQPVTRMPSLQSLVHLYLIHARRKDSVLTSGVSPADGFFIMDPDNNLTRTQERLKETFQSTKWDGVIGQAPSLDQYKAALENKDVVVPCVVGMLWEVMDKDTDLLTKEMVRAMIGLDGVLSSFVEEPGSLVPFLVAKARPLCSWYMISAALVVYGLPLKFSSQRSKKSSMLTP